VPDFAVVALAPNITDTGVVLEAIFAVGKLGVDGLSKSALLLVVGGGIPVNSELLTGP
jgi:hypothetical protein